MVNLLILIGVFLVFLGVFLIAYTPAKSWETLVSGKLVVGVFFLILAVIAAGLITRADAYTDIFAFLLWFFLASGSLLSL